MSNIANNANNDANEFLILSLFPLTGALGIHDFAVGRKKFGWIHLILSMIPILCWIYAALRLQLFSTPGNNSEAYLVMINVIISCPLLAFSYVWAVVEGFMLFPEMKTRSSAVKTKSSTMKTNSNAAKVNGSTRSIKTKGGTWSATKALLIALIPYIGLCIFYHCLSPTATTVYKKTCLIFGCYDGKLLYEIGVIIMIVCTLIGILNIKNRNSPVYWILAIAFMLSVINLFAVLCLGSNRLFI